MPLQREHAGYLKDEHPAIEAKIVEIGADVRDPFRQPLSVYRERRDEIDPISPTERSYMDRMWNVVVAWDKGEAPTVEDFILAERGEA